jgi:hypothetical protein
LLLDYCFLLLLLHLGKLGFAVNAHDDGSLVGCNNSSSYRSAFEISRDDETGYKIVEAAVPREKM